MNMFKRYTDPRRTLNVGESAMAKEIQSFYILDPQNMVTYESGKIGPNPILIYDSNTVVSYLKSIEEGTADRALRFFAVDFGDGKMIRLHRIKPRYIKYEGTTYMVRKV